MSFHVLYLLISHFVTVHVAAVVGSDVFKMRLSKWMDVGELDQSQPLLNQDSYLKAEGRLSISLSIRVPDVGDKWKAVAIVSCLLVSQWHLARHFVNRTLDQMNLGPIQQGFTCALQSYAMRPLQKQLEGIPGKVSLCQLLLRTNSQLPTQHWAV